MKADTRDINQRMSEFDHARSVWLFGYGSLMYKAGFEYSEKKPATIRGWVRRFWQGSHDHRGTPEAPGRVLTLVEKPGALCGGLAYRISPKVFGHLDEREKNGYLRLSKTLSFRDGGSAKGLVYLALEENEAWLGPASAFEIAKQVARSSGPSGPNRDYILNLAHALRYYGYADDHVFAIESHLKALIKKEKSV